MPRVALVLRGWEDREYELCGREDLGLLGSN
jgi:hypothetical protein